METGSGQSVTCGQDDLSISAHALIRKRKNHDRQREAEGVRASPQTFRIFCQRTAVAAVKLKIFLGVIMTIIHVLSRVNEI